MFDGFRIRKEEEEERIKNKKEKKKTEEKEKKNFKKFTFHPFVHHKFQKIFREINIDLAPVNNYKIKNLLKSETKDKIPHTKIWHLQNSMQRI